MLIHTLIKLEIDSEYILLGIYMSLSGAKEMARLDILSESKEPLRWTRGVGVDDASEYVARYKGTYYSCTYKIHKSLLEE
jgi:hypothetical protein